jgi:hypothetical protein
MDLKMSLLVAPLAWKTIPSTFNYEKQHSITIYSDQFVTQSSCHCLKFIPFLLFILPSHKAPGYDEIAPQV